MLAIVKRIFLLAVIFCMTVGVNSLGFASTTDSASFISIADIHFDPFTTCMKDVTPCPLIEKLQQAPVEQWEMLLATYDVKLPQYKQDTNYPLLKLDMTELQKIAVAENSAFVLVLGDLLGHNFRQNYDMFATDKTPVGYQAFVKKTLRFLTRKMANAFPSMDVYTVVGNNDSYQDDYFVEPNGAFFKEVADIAGDLIKSKNNQSMMKKEFSTAGYYAVDFPNDARLHLIVLNSVLFSKKVRGISIEHAALEELNWLSDELATVHINHQKALIVLHIPVGIDVYASLKNNPFTIISLWQPMYAEQLETLLQKYAANIMAILPAHFHMDTFQILSEGANTIPVSFTPGLSPLFGNNPGFKIYRYSSLSLQLQDFVTLRYSLGTTKEWSKEYDFNEIYNPHCFHCQIIEGMKNLQKQGDLVTHFIKYFALGTNSQPITTKWLPYYWCNIHAMTEIAYQNCVAAEK